MKFYTAAALLATVDATRLSVEMPDEPVMWRFSPSNPNTHALFCRVFGQDLRFGPCPVGRNLSRIPYPEGHFERLQDEDSLSE